MIAHDEDDLARIAQRQNSLDDLHGRRAPVNSVSEEHDGIVLRRLNHVEKGIQGPVAPMNIPNRKARMKKVLENPFFNAVQVKFSYAVTCHKAQGGQWPVVFVDQGYLTDEMLDISLLRWLYTAITRASERLYLVNFHPRFYGEEPDTIF